jgi:hypothetical protein
MTTTVLVSLILLGVLSIARLWIGVQLFLTARKSRLNNLYWLAAVFVLAVYSLFSPQLAGYPLANAWVFNMGFVAGQFCLAMFIHTTFYQGRKSPIAFMLGLFVLVLLATIYYVYVNDLRMATLVTGISLVNWIWHLIVAQSAYSAIAKDSSVEKWIKARYQLMMVYVVLITISTVFSVVASTTTLIPQSLVPLSILLVIASIILQFLVWVMPEPFRLWLNRTQQARPAAIEQHPSSVMDVFGSAMTTDTGLNTIACFYAIRSAIGKQIGTENSDAIRDHIQVMTYRDWEKVLQNAEIRRILINGGADQASAGKAIANAQQALVEKQSLLTLSAR